MGEVTMELLNQLKKRRNQVDRDIKECNERLTSAKHHVQWNEEALEKAKNEMDEVEKLIEKLENDT